MSRGSGLLRRRAAAQASLLAAAVTVLLPALVLVTLVRMHTAAADRDGLRKAFSDIPPTARTIVAAYDIGLKWPDPASRAETDHKARASIAEAFGAIPVGVDSTAASAAYGVDTVSPQVSVYFLAAPGLQDQARLLSGTWPRPTSAASDGGSDARSGAGSAAAPGAPAVFEAAISEAAAQAEHWKVGDTVAADSRLDSAEALGLADARVAAARTVFHVVEVLCAGYFALCLLQLLAASRRASRDSALLLQVFGLRASSGRLISVLVTLPLAVVATAAGVTAGAVLAPLVGTVTQGGRAVVGTAPTGTRWIAIASGAVLCAVVVGTLLDAALRRAVSLTVRLRAAEFE